VNRISATVEAGGYSVVGEEDDEVLEVVVLSLFLAEEALIVLLELERVVDPEVLDWLFPPELGE
jgi:hypothetical protein